MGDFVQGAVVKRVAGELTSPIEDVAAFAAIIDDVVANAALASAQGGTVVHATGSDSFSATLRCHAASGEVCTLGLSRTRVTLSSYEDDAIRTAVETWADTVPALA